MYAGDAGGDPELEAAAAAAAPPPDGVEEEEEDEDEGNAAALQRKAAQLARKGINFEGKTNAKVRFHPPWS